MTIDTRVAAEVAKLRAETAEIKQRMARAAVVAKQADERTGLRTRALELAVEKEISQAEYNAIDLRKKHRDEDLTLSQFEFQHTYNFLGYVAADTVQPCIEKLNSWDIRAPGCDITIIFNSPGGAVFNGMALFDFLRWLSRKGHKITTISLGWSASMAGILLQAGDHRIMARGAWLLIHEVAFSTSGKIGEIEDAYKLGERLKAQAADIFVTRSGGKLTRETLTENWTRKDWWISADESLGLGLCDEIR